jgi:thiamine biosynthesis lipoprotein ApbE
MRLVLQAVSTKRPRAASTSQPLHSSSGGSTLKSLNPHIQPDVTTSAAPPKVTDLVGFDHLLIEKADDSKYPTLQKTHTATAIDFSGMGAGYAVDQIGETLVSLGSTAHLVELGGEVRAWGQPSLVEEWHVALRTTETKPPEIIVLHHGQAVAVSRSVRGKRTVHPTTGEIVKLPLSAPAVVAYAATCAEADALATAHVLDGIRKARQDSSSVIQ